MNPATRDDRQQLHGEKYVERFDTSRQTLRVQRLLGRAQLPAAAHILDVGCGTGLLAHLLAGHYSRYVGVDFSQAMIDTARSRATSAGLAGSEFVCGDALEVMAGQPAAFDALFLLDISEHVPDGEWQAMINAAYSALKIGGKVYLHTPNLEFFVEQLKQRGWMQQFPEHIAVRDAKANCQFFHNAGFASVRCEMLAHYNILRLLHPANYIPLLGRYFAARLWITAKK